MRFEVDVEYSHRLILNKETVNYEFHEHIMRTYLTTQCPSLAPIYALRLYASYKFAQQLQRTVNSIGMGREGFRAPPGDGDAYACEGCSRRGNVYHSLDAGRSTLNRNSQ